MTLMTVLGIQSVFKVLLSEPVLALGLCFEDKLVGSFTGCGRTVKEKPLIKDRQVPDA